MNATAHANTSASPVTAVGSDHRGMFTNILVGAAIPLLALELAHRFEAAPLSAWQGIPRILLASAVAVAMAIFLSKRIARKQTQQAIANLDTLEQRLTAGGSNSSDDLVAFGDVAAALDHEHQLLPNAQTSVSSRARFQQLVDASQEMSQAARELGNRTEKLSQEGRSYVGQINDTSAAVDEIVDSIQQVADNSSASSKVAAEARRTATVGSQAVSNTIKGMQRIRGQVQSNAERIKQLGESTQQIGEIVQLISDVADRTSLLALNASIQAAMAGEAGQGFGVVAEEVEQLSQRCNDATKQMTRLVKGVQLETAEAVAGMEESIAEVVQGSKLASQAGEALADIDSVSARLAELIQSISAATKQQVRGGLLASRSMNEISAIMHGSASATKQAAQSAGQLAIMAESHWSNVERFHPTFQPTPLGTTVQGTTALQENAAAAGSCSLEETAECQPTGLDIAEMEPSPGELNDNTTEAALAGSATS